MADLHGCLSWEDLADWWAGELEPARGGAVEEHLLACEACARRGERIGELARGVEAIGRSGAFSGLATPAILGRLERDGVRVHRYHIAPGQVVPCSVWPEDQVMAAVLDVGALAAEGAGRLDLVAGFAGEPQVRVPDVPLDRATGTLTWVVPAAAERQRSRTLVSFRLLRVIAQDEEVAAEYTLAHEPWTGPSSPR